MTRIWAITWKDLRSTMRNVPALALMVLAPLALAGLLGFAFGSGEDFSVAVTDVAIANTDEGIPHRQGPDQPAAGNVVVSWLRSPQLGELVAVTETESASLARRRVDEGTDAAAVIIPADFSRTVYGTETGARTAIELYENPTKGIGGDIIESILGRALLTFNGARAAAAAAAELALRAGQAGSAEELARAAAADYARRDVAAAKVEIDRRPPRLPESEAAKDVGVIGVILAGMMVFFLFFGASNVARTILDEEQAGTLPRLFTTPATRQTILGGKFTSVFVTVAVQATILLVAGRVIFAIDWGRLEAVAALTIVAAAVASSLALLIVSLVHTPGQAGAISSGVYLVLALLGGNFVGTATTTGVYATVQLLTPNGWLLKGWKSVMRGGGLADVALNLLVTALFALAFFAVALWRFRRRYA